METARLAVDLGLAELAARGSDRSLGVVFFGGEPLLQSDLILETIRHCKEIERRTGQLFYFKLTTNGLLLDRAFLQARETKDLFIALSHDGVKPAHDRHRVDLKGNGTFDRIDARIDLLLKYKPFSPVLLVVTPATVEHFAASVDYLSRRGFRYLITSLNYGTDWTEKDLRALERQYKRLAKWYIDRTKKEEKFYFSPFEVKIASHIFPGRCRAERCELGRTQISVAPNGRLYPCVQFVGDGSDETYAIGHVESGLDDAARERLQARAAAEPPPCDRCAVRERCNHFCACLNKQSTGRIDQVSPLLCAHERIVLPISDRVAETLFRRRDPLFIQKHYNELYPVLSLVEEMTSPRSL